MTSQYDGRRPFNSILDERRHARRPHYHYFITTETSSEISIRRHAVAGAPARKHTAYISPHGAQGHAHHESAASCSPPPPGSFSFSSCRISRPSAAHDAGECNDTSRAEMIGAWFHEAAGAIGRARCHADWPFISGPNAEYAMPFHIEMPYRVSPSSRRYHERTAAETPAISRRANRAIKDGRGASTLMPKQQLTPADDTGHRTLPMYAGRISSMPAQFRANSAKKVAETSRREGGRELTAPDIHYYRFHYGKSRHQLGYAIAEYDASHMRGDAKVDGRSFAHASRQQEADDETATPSRRHGHRFKTIFSRHGNYAMLMLFRHAHKLPKQTCSLLRHHD